MPTSILPQNQDEQELYNAISSFFRRFKIGNLLRKCNAQKEKGIPVILDTDDKDKAARYEHLGMKLDRVRNCGERFHMYDLIKE